VRAGRGIGPDEQGSVRHGQNVFEGAAEIQANIVSRGLRAAH
jgi:hypothetical protein